MDAVEAMDGVAPRFSKRQGRVALLVLALWMGLWVLLGIGPLRLGPHRFDDFRYAADAILGVFDEGVRFRYVHIWTLRGAYALIDDRVLAAATYAACVHAALIGAVTWLAYRIAGPGVAILSALLCPFFPALLQFISTPLTDPPCTLYAVLALIFALPAERPESFWGKRGGQLLAATLAGLCCFASIKCKETGIAALPPVLWLLARQPEGRRGRLLSFIGGALLGQALLCVADAMIVGDALQSLRFTIFKKYTKVLTGAPVKETNGRNLMRDEWMELLVSRGTRWYLLGTLLGLAQVRRRTVALTALLGFGVCVLLFSAWVSWRYSGIDAHIRYLGPLSPLLVIGSALALQRGFVVAPVPRATVEEPANGRSAASYLLLLLASAGALWIAGSGLLGGLQLATLREVPYPAQRSAFLLLPLVPLLSLLGVRAFTHRLARRAASLAALCAIVLLALTVSQRYIAEARPELQGWQLVAHEVGARKITKVQRLRMSDKDILKSLVQWRLIALADTSLHGIKVEDTPSVEAADKHALLMTNRSDRGSLMKAEKSGWVRVTPFRRLNRHFVALRYRGPVSPTKTP